MSNAKLWLSFNNSSKLALSIPLAECERYAVNPLKWLRFLGYAIYGQEGYLSRSKAGPEINDYTVDIEARSYYFVSEDDPRFVDVDAVDDRTSDASDLSERRADFRQRVIARDSTCVITADPAHMCAACHILPHSKGDNYLSNAVRHRGGADNHVNDLNDIDDTRNGLLLLQLLHIPFGNGESAFLKTPNFALDVDDIPYNPPREAEDSPASRLTLHHFVGLPRLGRVLLDAAPNNSDARQPQDTREWPPAVIVDLFYASAALQAWGPKAFIKTVRESARDLYYDNTEDDSGVSNYDAPGSGPGVSNTHEQPTTTPRSARYAARNEAKTQTVHLTAQSKETHFSDLMDGVVVLWMQSKRKSQPKLQDTHASDLARNQDDIQAWLQATEESN